MRGWVLVLGLAACARPGLDATGWPVVTAEPTAGFVPAAESVGMPVRAVARSGRETRVVEDAACVATGDGFRAAFVAPAVVGVPAYGRDSGPVRVECAAGGLRGARIVEPMVQRTDGLWGWPAIGIGVSSDGDTYASFGGWWSRGEGDGTAVHYPSVEVALR